MSVNLNPNIQKSFNSNFEFLCISCLIEGYNNALLDNKYDINWKENSFTNYLSSFIRKANKVNDHFIRVDVQVQPENNKLPEEKTENDPDKQPIIDIRLSNWYGTENNVYFFEAKNICEKDWTKNNGSKVSASKLKRRYIKTGIENFILGRYPKGCLIGYVLNSKTTNCVDGINKLLLKDNRINECLFPSPFIPGFSNSFKSIHYPNNKTELKHIFLKF